MTCEETRTQLHGLARGRLDSPSRAAVGAHLESCQDCAAAERAERALDELLAARLQRYDAPPALRRRLGLLMSPSGLAPRSPRRRVWAVAPALAACVALVVVGVLAVRGAVAPGALAVLSEEAVNDHLRVLASGHPVDIESGGRHQVKPWFEGKIDFAPVVPALEGTGAVLRGGAVGYVFDRKAAVLVYGHGLHLVTLLAFPAEGLPWPRAGGRRLGATEGHEASSRGFHVLLWRDGHVGYALVSDIDAQELDGLAARAAAETTQAPPR